MKIRAHLYITGDVQGVFFRYSARLEAKHLGVVGWAKNLWDGRVEVVAEGEKEDVEKLIDWCEYGPPEARVDNIDVTTKKYTGEFKEFRVM